jgi:hypothetical protein
MSVQDREDQEGRVGPFVTYVERVRPDGALARWDSRRHRKHPPGTPATGSTWWAPRARGWWIAVLFAIGSLLFALGAITGYASAVGASWDAVTFFTGSLFFTAAAFLTYREAVDAGPQPPGTARRRFFVYQPGWIDCPAWTRRVERLSAERRRRVSSLVPGYRRGRRGRASTASSGWCRCSHLRAASSPKPCDRRTSRAAARTSRLWSIWSR